MRRIFRIFIAAMLIAALPAVAQEEDGRHWFTNSYDHTTTLVYGTPDSDDDLLFFSCDAGKPVVNACLQDWDSSAKDGALLQVSLAAAAERVEFAEKAIQNDDTGGIDVWGELPLTPALRRILSATGALEIVIDGNTQRYPLDDFSALASTMLATCDAPMPVDELNVTVTNKTRRPLWRVAYSASGEDSFEFASFGYRPLDPEASRVLSIPGGRLACTFDLQLIFVDDTDEPCCNEAELHAQDLCRDGVLIIQD